MLAIADFGQSRLGNGSPQPLNLSQPSNARTARVETYDIIMLIVLLGTMIFGAVKGFAWQLASLSSIIISYVVAYRFRQPFSESIQAEPPWDLFLAMLILYVGCSLVIWVLFRMVRRSIDRMKLREFDRQVGALFGLAKGALYCILITLFTVTLAGDQAREKIVVSKSGRYIADVLDRSESVIPPEIHDVVGPYLQRFDQQFDQQFAQPPAALGGAAERIANGAPLRSDGSTFWDNSASPPLPLGQPSGNSWAPQPRSSTPWNGGQP